MVAAAAAAAVAIVSFRKFQSFTINSNSLKKKEQIFVGRIETRICIPRVRILNTSFT